MKLRSTDGLLTLSIFLVYTEIILALVFNQLLIGVIAVIITLFLIGGYYFINYIKALKEVSGNMVLSLQLFFSHDEFIFSDCLIEEYKEINISSYQLKKYELTKEYLEQFESYIKVNKIQFPSIISPNDLVAKHYYLELLKRIPRYDLDTLLEEWSNFKVSKDNPRKPLSEIFLNKLESITKGYTSLSIEDEEIEENTPEIIEITNKEQLAEIKEDFNIEESKNEEITEGENTQTINKKKKTENEESESEESENEESESIYDYFKQNTFFQKVILFILFINIISLTLMYFELYKDQSLFFAMGSSILFFFLLYLNSKSLQKQKNKQDNEENETIDLEDREIELSVNEISRFYPFYHYTHVIFKEMIPISENDGFKDCIIISPKSFFDSFHLSRSYISYNNLQVVALSSTAVFEVVGWIENSFPILLTKFCTGLINLDQENLLEYQSIENARVKTYYRKLCELNVSNETLNDEILNLRASKESMRQRLIKNRNEFVGESNLKPKEMIEKLSENIDTKIPPKFNIIAGVFIVLIVVLFLKIFLGV